MATPSRHEIEHLHRLMMQASVDASRHDHQLQHAQKQDGLSRHLLVWRQAANEMRAAVGRARIELQAGGTTRTQVDTLESLFDSVQTRARRFDLDAHLDSCVADWKMSALQLAQVSGKPRDVLVKALSQWQPRIDEATRGLSAAQATFGMAPETFRKVRTLQDSRDQARGRYERLRIKYLEAEQSHQVQVGRPAVHAPAGTPARAAQVIVPPWAQGGKRGPVIVKLPVQHAAQGPAAHRAGLTGHAPRGNGLHSLPHTGSTPPSLGMPAAKKPPAQHGIHPQALQRPQPGTSSAHPVPGHSAPRPVGGLQPQPAASTLRGAQRLAQQVGLARVRARGPLRITLEKVDRPAGFPTGTDGIGRGSQSAHLFFRADNFDGALSISGTTSISLGCNTRLEVAPSLQLFSSTPGQPARGRLSLGLVASGGRLGFVSPRSALENARRAATDAGVKVAGKVGPIGLQLQKAITELLAEAAVKIFTLAQANAVPHRVPSHQPGRPRAGHLPVEHHVARFDHALGGILHQARSVKSPGTRHNLHHILDREHAHGGGVARRLETTLAHLATATHRTLTDAHAGELRNHLARMDSVLARLRGQGGDALLEGAHEIGQILTQMGSIAATKGGALHVGTFRKLIDERRGQLAKLAGEARKGQGAHAHRPPGQPLLHMPSAQVLGEKALERLRKQHPGLDQLLRNASTSHLVQELAKVEKGALQALGGKGHVHGYPHQAPQHGLGGMSLGVGMGAALGGGHRGGLGGGHRGGTLGQAPVQGGLHQLHAHHAHALHREMKRQSLHHKHQAVTRALSEMGKAPKGSPLHDLAVRTEERRKAMVGRGGPMRHGPPASAITAAAFQAAFRDHPRGHGHAAHFAKGGPLHTLLDATQRSHGLPIASMASHFLAARGESRIFNAVQMFHGLVKNGHKPRFAFWSHLKDSVSHSFQKATTAVTDTVNRVRQVAQNYDAPVAAGMSSFANQRVQAAPRTMNNVVTRGVGFERNGSHGASNRAQRIGSSNYAHRPSQNVHTLGSRISDGVHGLAHARDSAMDWSGQKAHGLGDWVKKNGSAAFAQNQNSGRKLWSGMQHNAHWLGDKSSGLGQAALQGVKNLGAAQWSGLKTAGNAAGGALSWIGNKVGGAATWPSDKSQAAAGWVMQQTQKNLEWVGKTGVVGAVGGMIKNGLSNAGPSAGAAWKMSPLGMAVSKGWALAKNPLTSIWNKTKNIAGQAWSGIQKGYKATSNFLQSPAGQFLVTGLSLAATFIPGGILVKTLIGAGIGAISAISEGKNWKGVLAGAAGGALTGALPFLRIGPLAKMGVGALQGAIGTVASGGNWKDAVKGAAGGALDAFDPGALKQLKSLKMAGKLLSGKNMSEAEKLAMGAGKMGGPLHALEKAMANPRARKLVGALEKTGGKVVRGSIYVSGKAAKVQDILDKTLAMGDKADGALKQIHDNAPGVANFFGNNAVGHFISRAGDLAGNSDEKLSHALEWGHARADQLSTYRGDLDKGLNHAGVKDPAKAYERQMAHRSARGGSLSPLAQKKLADHRSKHPELHIARATGKRVRGEDRGESPARRRGTDPVRGHGVHPVHGGHAVHDSHAVHGSHPVHRRHGGRSTHPKTALERAIQRGRHLKKQGLQVAAGVHHQLGNIHHIVAKGLEHADQIQHGLEQATNLARQGAGFLGEDTELGRYLLHMADRAEQAHGYIEQGIGFAHDFNHSLGGVNHTIGHIPGEHQAEHDRYGKKMHGDHASPLHQAVHLDGKPAHRQGGGGHDGTPVPGHQAPDHGERLRAVHPAHSDVRKPAHESDAAHADRLKKAFEAIGNVSRRVNAFEAKFGKIAANIQKFLHSGKAQAASLEMQSLGSECEEIQKIIRTATTLAHGHAGYEKEIRFYLEWHARARAKVHGMIADTRGLGDGAAISGFGVDEKRHPDIFQNTRDIYAIQSKVNAFGDALADHEAHTHVEKVLSDAKAAKAQLAGLKNKYKGDKAALDFLTGHGIQDKLIDEQIARLEKALRGEHHAAARKPVHSAHVAPAKKAEHDVDVRKNIEHGLKAIDRYKKHALRTGRKIDGSLEKIEHALHTGIRIGRKVDHGLHRISGLAGQVAGFLGEDSPLGHLAGQVHDRAEAGHERFHGAMKLAHKGSKQLHRGHAIFHNLLDQAAAHHQRKHEQKHPWHTVQHGPHGAVLHGPHGTVPHGPHGPHQAGHGGHGIQLPAHLKLPKVLQDLVDKAKSLKDLPEWLLHELGLGGGEKKPPRGKRHHHHHHMEPQPDGRPSPGPAPHPQHKGEMTEAEAADLVHRANLAVTGFGKGVTNAIREITAMMHEGRTKDAAYRVQAVTAGSEQTRFECSRAVQFASKNPLLQKQAQLATKHYLEIRDHFFQFVRTLHGLAGQAEIDGLDAAKYPDLVALQAAIDSLEVKVNALGDVKSADTKMQAAVAPLKQEASALHGRLGHAKAKYQKDPPAETAIDAMWSKLGRLQRILGGHADKGNVEKGDKELGLERHHAPKKPRKLRRHGSHRKHDSVDDLINSVLDDNRLHVNRGGNRGDVEQQDGQDVDPAAMDTWLGSGHGVELFSQVFGAFIPAHGASGGHEGHGSHGGHHEAHVVHKGRGGEGQQDPHGHGMHPRQHRNGRGGILGRIGKLIPGKAHGFFHGLFDKLHGFADQIGSWAHQGESLLGKGMHLAEQGMHGLGVIEDAAEKMQGFAGKAEGFLNKLHLGKAAHFAHQIGGAAGFVDKEALLLHGGLKKADDWMGVGKKDLTSVEKFSNRAGRAFARAEQGHLGGMMHLFKASRFGDGIDGKGAPEKARLNSMFDEPRRLDLGTMSRMEGFLGGDLSSVRLHTGPGAAHITSRYNAEAVTVKDHIFFAPGRFNTQSVEGQKLLAHELTHVLQRGRPNLDVRTAESEALGSERSYGSPQMETLNLGKPSADFKLADGEGLGSSSGVHTAKRNRSRGHESGGKDELPDGEEFIERVSGRVYELLMEELEHSFESR